MPLEGMGSSLTHLFLLLDYWNPSELHLKKPHFPKHPVSDRDEVFDVGVGLCTAGCVEASLLSTH